MISNSYVRLLGIPIALFYFGSYFLYSSYCSKLPKGLGNWLAIWMMGGKIGDDFFPRQYMIDYVRVYEKGNSSEKNP